MPLRRDAVAVVAALMLLAPALACDLVPAPRSRPLSRVTVTNMTDEPRLARMNWPDGFVQVARVEPRSTSYLSGAIGTSGFPVTIDVLDEACEVLYSVPGLAPGSYGMVVVTDESATIHALDAGDHSWTVAGSVDVCGATPVGDPPVAPPDTPPTPTARTSA